MNRRSFFACLAGFVTLPRPYVVDELVPHGSVVRVVGHRVVWGEAAYDAALEEEIAVCRRVASLFVKAHERVR